ncbi:hypothetical protein Z043_107653, partial [Scleropages formosus]
VSSLKSKLKKQSTATGSGVARAFLRAQAALFGSYRDALRYRPFIDGRLAKLNAGRGFTDVFEEEITEGGFCRSNSRSYQQWTQTVKKGGALINTAVTKASPAVKTAYKFVSVPLAKSHAKQGIKEMKSRLKPKEAEDDDGPVCSGSPTSTKSLSPKRLQKRRRVSELFDRKQTGDGERGALAPDPIGLCAPAEVVVGRQRARVRGFPHYGGVKRRCKPGLSPGAERSRTGGFVCQTRLASNGAMAQPRLEQRVISGDPSPSPPPQVTPPTRAPCETEWCARL